MSVFRNTGDGSAIRTGTLEAGRRTEGYVFMRVPEDARRFEMYMRLGNTENTIKFEFDIPPLDETVQGLSEINININNADEFFDLDIDELLNTVSDLL